MHWGPDAHEKEHLVIDPYNITRYDRTPKELEELFIFCVCVAGKNAITTARAVQRFLTSRDFRPRTVQSPFYLVRHLARTGKLEAAIQDAGMGQWTRIAKALSQAASSGIDLARCTVSDLEKINGVGRKTSRFFIVHSRMGARHAIMDVHILRWMRDRGHEVPKGTPNKREYERLERLFLEECDARGVAPSTLDLQIWSEYRDASLEKRKWAKHVTARKIRRAAA
jgi:thermostable 8-oxoguanine DNA glycosylase